MNGSMERDVIIIGAGAAGMFCAAAAGKRGRSVLVIDHAPKTGSKIRISGGGRCNFTNRQVTAENYISRNPHFCKSALSRFTPDDIMHLVRKHGIPFHEEEDGQVFCDVPASAVVRMLEAECRGAGADVLLHTDIRRVSAENGFAVETGTRLLRSRSLVIATGGLSWPKLGATDLGYRIAAQFAVRVIPPRPGLVPLTFPAKEYGFFRDLRGISLNVLVSCRDKKFRGGMLFTHRGLSGPAVLQASSYWNKGDTITIDLLPDTDLHEFFREHRTSRKEIHNLLSGLLPQRFAQAWCGLHTGIRPLCRFTDKELTRAADLLHQWTVRPSGTEGYPHAEVTIGGIDTNEVSSKTMESRTVQGLFFIGEVLDVTGQLGGYNLHWAWASGLAAGQAV